MNTNKTIVIKLKGGMGNQMFQYAFGKALEASAKKTDEAITLLFDTTAYTDPVKKDTRRPYMLEHLNINANVANDEVALKARNPRGIISKILRRVLHKLHIGNITAYCSALLTPPYKNYYEGYWQTEKYFSSIIEQIRQEFTLKEPMGAMSQDIHTHITSDPNAVSIFYRRTDYVGDKTFDISEQDYQQRAVAHMRSLVPNMTLYVMSDDIAWVQENVDLPQDSIFVSSEDIPHHEEMMLAAACKHHIIPNSTFAWWGAWLNQDSSKIVIAPKNWTCKNDDRYKDITPNNWLRV